MGWLIQRVVSMFNRQSNNGSGMTHHERGLGRRSNGRTAEFSERTLHYVRKRLRAKVARRWHVGYFLGTAARSSEANVGTASGNFVKSRDITKVAHECKRDKNGLFSIQCTPARMCPNVSGNQDSPWIASSENPILHRCVPSIDAQAAESPPTPVGEQKDERAAPLLDPRAMPRIRMTPCDLDRYGLSHGCKRCVELRGGADTLPSQAH